MKRQQWTTFFAVTILLAVFTGLAVNALIRESATFDETTHHVAGYSY